MICSDCAILLVEDEFLIAMDLKMQLEAAGYPVQGPVASVEEGMALLDGVTICAAILDLNLGDYTSFPIADRLADQGTPFIFLSGNDASHVAERFPDHTVLTKPIDYDHLFAELKPICGF